MIPIGIMVGIRKGKVHFSVWKKWRLQFECPFNYKSFFKFNLIY